LLPVSTLPEQSLVAGAGNDGIGLTSIPVDHATVCRALLIEQHLPDLVKCPSYAIRKNYGLKWVVKLVFALDRYGFAACRSADWIVLEINIVTVIGPTPPGTGVT